MLSLARYMLSPLRRPSNCLSVYLSVRHRWWRVWPCDSCSRVCSSRIGLRAHQQTHRWHAILRFRRCSPFVPSHGHGCISRRRLKWGFCSYFHRTVLHPFSRFGSEIYEIPRNSASRPIRKYSSYHGHPRSSILVSIESEVSSVDRQCACQQKKHARVIFYMQFERR